jgi:two-component system response regulator HydG
MMMGRILLVDDDGDAVGLLKESLQQRGFDVHAVAQAKQALQALSEGNFSVVITSMQLDGMSGVELCSQVAEHHANLPVVVISRQGSLEVTEAALRAGAYDCVSKPFSIDQLVLTLIRSQNQRQPKSRALALPPVVEQNRRIDDIVGDSPAIRRVFELIERVADTDASILITGESGTGKDLMARAVHARSSRRCGPFVAINCAAMPATLLESEFFGHVRGAFTDARQSRQGIFLQASGGTVFLDEVAEMPLEMQVKLLRVLQARKVRPVGGDSEVAFNARLITATNGNLESQTESGRFRSDLYYRINVVHIHLPPLRERREDILFLARHFLKLYRVAEAKEVADIGHDAAGKLLDYDWPGNVRELENCIERAVALTRKNEICSEDLPDKIREHKGSRICPDTDSLAELLPLAEMEQRYIKHVLAAVGGNKSHAARVLGLDRRSLYRRLDDKYQHQRKALPKP